MSKIGENECKDVRWPKQVRYDMEPVPEEIVRCMCQPDGLKSEDERVETLHFEIEP